MLKKWEDLPAYMKCPQVREYWEILNKKRIKLIFKRIFDFLVSFILVVITAVPMAVIALLIKRDSPGTAFYRQERVTSYGKHFKIHKFRTMSSDADTKDTALTVSDDGRITKIGRKLRKYRLDELPQLFDILEGNMSFVGTRPEVIKYVEQYKPEYYATLLMPAGVTNETSIIYKNESELLSSSEDVEKTYIEQVLPEKMKLNLESIRKFGLLRDIGIMFNTVFSVLKRQ
ncbi:MAG: sugar transferase [Clostridia bacterium]|nr:sugar transferase [Clostridia bacterium]